MRVEAPARISLPTPEPRFIEADGRRLFTWHHAPAPQLRRGAGVVLCPALGYESMSAYATWRLLAERLASLGFDVLRLDYDGTGNSTGDYDEPGRFDAWLGSIGAAMDRARELAGSSRVGLVGLRAGALLALQAAAVQGSADRLVLWSAFPSGRALVRELKAFARLSRQEHASEESIELDVNVAGHLLAADAVKSIGRWTLEAVTTAPAPRVLLVDRDDRSEDQVITARLEALGCDVARIRPDGTAAMLAPPHFAQVPREALDAIASWLDDWPISAPPVSDDARRRCGPGARPGGARRLQHDNQERPVRFGAGNRLFGMLSPPHVDVEGAPSIVLFNTGLEHHVGPHRLYVSLAREWAAHGHCVLRFDLGGIGDSDLPPGATGPVAYPGHMLEDAREAIAFVRSVAPHKPIMAAGLCSGGWLAFCAARDGLDVAAVVAVNPPLYLRDGLAGKQWFSEADELERYHRSMRDPSKWAKALRGAASYSTFAGLVAAALRRQVAAWVGVSVRGGLATDLAVIAGRGVRTLFVFSRGDFGLDYWQLHWDPARAPALGECIQHVVVDGAGHSFRPRAAQQKLRELLTHFASWPAAAPTHEVTMSDHT